MGFPDEPLLAVSIIGYIALITITSGFIAGYFI